ncbi:endonuclease/exonuclease/phosphatase family protein [Streptomyces sp. NPDC004111]|uniref:endonuclease/exonuclease/phosphatase family protein n=1 Tax=Streptomyces sp. NPDC004111 TaxID=3364690 RepID=UPI003678E410
MDTPDTRGAGAGRGSTVVSDGDSGVGPTVGRRPRPLLSWASALLLTGTGIVVGCRALGIDAVTPVPQLLAFLPWLLVPTGCALLLALLAGRPVLIGLALLVAAVNSWFLLPYEPAGAAVDDGPVVARLRVLAANVEFGRATPGLISAVRSEKPDLVFVPECDHGCARSLATELPAAAYPYRKVVARGGAEGSAILSTYPLKPAEGIASTLAMPGAVAVVGGQQVRVQLAHPLPPVPRHLGTWRTELEAIRAYVAGGGGPTLVAGDFNASQDHAAFRRVLDAGAGLRDSAAAAGAARTPTWPAKTLPVLGTQIDHVLVSREFSVRNVRFLDLPQTDHRALLTDLQLHTP